MAWKKAAYEIRTHDPRITNTMHYLCAKVAKIGIAGFEPTTFCSQSRRSTKLSHIPKVVAEGLEPPKSKTRDLQSLLVAA